MLEGDFKIEAYGTVTPPPDALDESEDTGEVGDEVGDED